MKEDKQNKIFNGVKDCIFCKIVAGEIPSYKVYEDEGTLAFLDINPISDGHCLVIPKKHYNNIEEISEEELKELIISVKKVGLAVKEKLGAESYNVCENNDPAAGQEIPHLHFHVVPRYKGDSLQAWPHKTYPEGKAEEVLEKIKIIKT